MRHHTVIDGTDAVLLEQALADGASAGDVMLFLGVQAALAALQRHTEAPAPACRSDCCGGSSGGQD